MVLYCVAIVQLPSKRDFWSKGFHWMPSHPICNENSTNLPLDESFPLWKHLPRSLHKRDKGNFDVRPACAYCAWKYKKFATLSNTMTYSKIVSRKSLLCYYCNMYLHRQCFDWFDNTTDIFSMYIFCP